MVDVELVKSLLRLVCSARIVLVYDLDVAIGEGLVVSGL